MVLLENHIYDAFLFIVENKYFEELNIIPNHFVESEKYL